MATPEGFIPDEPEGFEPDTVAAERGSGIAPQARLGREFANAAARGGINMLPGLYATAGGALGLLGGPLAPAASPTLAAMGGVYGLHQRNRLLGLDPPTMGETMLEGGVDALTGGTSAGIRAGSPLAARSLLRRSVNPSADRLARNPQMMEQIMERGVPVGRSGAAARVGPLKQEVATQRAVARAGARREVGKTAASERAAATKVSKDLVRGGKNKYSLEQIADKYLARKAELKGSPLTNEERIDAVLEVQEEIKSVGMPGKASYNDREMDNLRRLMQDKNRGRYNQVGRGNARPVTDVTTDIASQTRELQHGAVSGLAGARATEAVKIATQRAIRSGSVPELARLADEGQGTARMAIDRLSAANRVPADAELALQQAMASAEARQLPAPVLAYLGSKLAYGLNSPAFQRYGPMTPFALALLGRPLLSPVPEDQP